MNAPVPRMSNILEQDDGMTSHEEKKDLAQSEEKQDKAESKTVEEPKKKEQKHKAEPAPK